MSRSPLHLLIALHRFLLRNKARHRSIHPLFRPIIKTASWSAGIISKIPNTSSPILTKYIPTLGQQRQQTNQLIRVIQQHSTSTTRRLFIHHRSQGNGSLCTQRRTMVSSGSSSSSSNGGSHITTVLNATQFFTPRPPILGVHGTPLLPPPPPASFRSYSTVSPWNLRQQQYFITPHSTTNDDIDNVGDDDDDDYFEIDTRPHRINRQYFLTNPAIAAKYVAGDHDDGDDGELGIKRQSYRPPDIRGMADLMENNDEDQFGSNTRDRNHTNINVVHSSGNGNKIYHPGLVHRGQAPRRTPPQQSQQQQQTRPKGMFISPVDVLRHDDLSLQTTKKKASSGAATSTATATDSKCPQQQWYISIPMDLIPPSHDNNTTSSSFSALESLIFRENAVSILDPAWLTSFDSWGKLIREHLAKVMVLIQLVGMEAQRYCRRRHSEADGLATTTTATTMDFKMMMKKSDTRTELHIYLPHQFFTPLPTTRSNIQHWVDQLMKDPPGFEIKCHSSTNNNNTDNSTTMAMNGTTPLDSPEARWSRSEDRMDISETEDDDLVIMVPSTMTETDQKRANGHNDDGTSWHIGPHYFQGIHTFLNHVDSMIDSSPAFTTGGSQR